MTTICPMCGSAELDLLQRTPHNLTYRCRNCKEWFTIQNKHETVTSSNDYILPNINYPSTLRDPKGLEWPVIEQEIEKNKIDRFDWRKYLGESLTKAIAKLKAQKFSKEEAYDDLRLSHPKLSAELLRKLKIGIIARYGEINTAEAAKK